MLPYRWAGIIKFADILCICIFIGSFLFGRPGLIGKKEGVILRTLILFIMFVLQSNIRMSSLRGKRHP